MIIDTYFHQSQDRKTVKCNVIGGKKSVSLKFCFNGLNLYVGARIYTVSDLGFVHLTRGYQNKVFDIVYEWPKTKQRYLLSPSEMLGRASNEVPFFYSCLTAQTSVGQFFCVSLSSICFLSRLDSCLQTYILKKIKAARFMLCLS